MSEIKQAPPQQEIEEKPEGNAKAFSNPWEKTKTEWVDLLENEIPHFKGNKQHAAKLLFELSRGIRIVDEKLKARGLSYEPPRLAILHGEGSNQISIVHDQDNDCVVIGKEFLANLAAIDPEPLQAFKRDDGEITFKGRLADLVRNLGVEEAHHSAFYQYKQKKIPFINALDMPMSEYDSSDHEYRALLWQKRVAEEQGDPSITVEHLVQRIEAAKKERAERMKIKNSSE